MTITALIPVAHLTIGWHFGQGSAATRRETLAIDCAHTGHSFVSEGLEPVHHLYDLFLLPNINLLFRSWLITKDGPRSRCGASCKHDGYDGWTSEAQEPGLIWTRWSASVMRLPLMNENTHGSRSRCVRREDHTHHGESCGWASTITPLLSTSPCCEKGTRFTGDCGTFAAAPLLTSRRVDRSISNFNHDRVQIPVFHPQRGGRTLRSV